MKASKGAPDNESIYAAEGTAAHYLSELGRRHSLPCSHWFGHTFIVGEHKFVVDDEMADSAQAFNDWCAKSPGTPLTEQRINYSAYFPEAAIAEFGPAFGTLDDARLNHDIVAIKDFKHGKGVQEWAKDNSQLKLQALGVLEDFGYLYNIKGFDLGICQPRLNHYDSWEISVEDLVKWAEDTIPGWAARAMEGKQFKAGDWCKFCRIRKKCAVRANQNMALMMEQSEFDDLDNLPVHALRGRNAGHHITSEQLAKILPALDTFAAWIKDMRTRAVLELNAGVKLDGWKLVEGRSNRRWGKEEGAVAVMMNRGINPYKNPEIRSVSEVEKALGKKQFAEMLGGFVVKPPGAPKLAPADDKRQAITGIAIEEFDNLDEE